MSDHLPEYIVMTRLICRDQGATIYEMAEALEKDVKTARNRLRELTYIFPLYSETDPDNAKRLRYKILKHSSAQFILPDMSFSDDEKAVFKMLSGSTDMTPALESQTRKLFNKLTLMASERGSLIKAGANEPVPIINAQTIVPKSVDNKTLYRKINRLLKAIADKSWLTLIYHRIYNDSTYEMDFYPVLVFISHRNPYVYGYNKNGKLRMLAVDRIVSIEGDFIASKPKYDMNLLKDLLSDPFGISCEAEAYEVKLLIADSQVPYEKEKQWPKGKVSFKETKEGTVMTAVTHTRFDVQRYILKRTPYIKVLEPEWLKDSVVAAYKEGLGNYSV
ncbi:MAG: WYL domain-containing protein [Sphaerochaetaceae bacterium]|nr:WYL domain-containing protein [Sphaerochaetaceae bacterium]